MSKTFIRKVRAMTPAQQQDVSKTIAFILANPENDDFKRPYLTPYLQEHLPQDKQRTVYFQIQDADETAYFVWINDDSCLHTTRKPTEDPDVKEFDRLRKANELEVYDKNFHGGDFKVTPKEGKPTFFDLKKLGARIFCNVFQGEDGNLYTTGLRVIEDEFEDAYDLVEDFLGRLANHFKTVQKSPFEFRLYTDAYEELIAEIKRVADPKQWKLTIEDEMTIIKVI